MMRGIRKHWHIVCYIAKLCEQLWKTLKKAQTQSMSGAKRQKQYYDRKANVFTGERWPGLGYSWHLQGEEESEGPVGGGIIWSETPSCWRSPFIPHEKPVDMMLMSPPLKVILLHHSCRGDTPLYGHASYIHLVHPHHANGTNSGEEWDWEVPWFVNCLLPA